MMMELQPLTVQHVYINVQHAQMVVLVILVVKIERLLVVRNYYINKINRCPAGTYDNTIYALCPNCDHKCATCETTSDNCLSCQGTNRVAWATNNDCM